MWKIRATVVIQNLKIPIYITSEWTLEVWRLGTGRGPPRPPLPLGLAIAHGVDDGQDMTSRQYVYILDTFPIMFIQKSTLRPGSWVLG